MTKLLQPAFQARTDEEIRDTFAHVLKAEISFLKRIHGIYPEPDFKWEENPSLSQMMAYETALHETLLDTLRTFQQLRMCMKKVMVGRLIIKHA